MDDRRQKLVAKWHDKFRMATIEKIFNGDRSNPPFGLAVNFQKLVRMAAADDDGYCICVTCGKQAPWQRMNGGHFITRANKATIIDPRNVNPQCVYCNHHKGGAEAEHRKYLVKKYGEAQVRELEQTRLPDNHIWNRYELAVTKVELLEELRFHERRLE